MRSNQLSYAPIMDAKASIVVVRLVFVCSLTCCFCLLLTFYAGFFVSLTFAEVTDDTVTGALTFESTDCVIYAFVFADSDC